MYTRINKMKMIKDRHPVALESSQEDVRDEADVAMSAPK